MTKIKRTMNLQVNEYSRANYDQSIHSKNTTDNDPGIRSLVCNDKNNDTDNNRRKKKNLNRVIISELIGMIKRAGVIIWSSLAAYSSKIQWR